MRWSSPTRAGRASPTRTRSRATPSGPRCSRTPLAAWGKAACRFSFHRFLGVFLVKNLSYCLFRILSIPFKIACKGAFSGFILCLQFWQHLESRAVKSWSQEESWCSLKNQCSQKTVGLLLLFFWEKSYAQFRFFSLVMNSVSLNKTNKDLALYFVALKCTPVRCLLINVSAEVGSYLFLGLVVSKLQ